MTWSINNAHRAHKQTLRHWLDTILTRLCAPVCCRFLLAATNIIHPIRCLLHEIHQSASTASKARHEKDPGQGNAGFCADVLFVHLSELGIIVARLGSWDWSVLTHHLWPSAAATTTAATTTTTSDVRPTEEECGAGCSWQPYVLRWQSEKEMRTA